MKKRQTSIARNERSRWFVAAAAAVMIWTSWVYCMGGNMGLFITTSVLSVVAVIRKRNFPRRARWVIWSWVLVAVICLAANVDRVMPTEGELQSGLVFDRVATFLFSFGICSLFFLYGRLQVSLVAISSMPLVMIAFRERNGLPLGAVYEQLIVWVFIFLIVVLDYTCRCTRPTELGGRFRISLRKGVSRWLWLGLTLCAAYFIRIPVEELSLRLQRMAYGINYGGRSNRRSPMNVTNGLYLSRHLPKGYRQRMRLLLLIDSPRVPGYLRENVFTTYKKGRWLKPEHEGDPIPAVNAEVENENDERTFILDDELMQGRIDDWVVDVMSPQMLSAVCLPGSAASISSRDPAPFVNSNGVVTIDAEYASQYRIGVGEQHKFMTPSQKSGGFSDPAYLEVPENISKAVSNWVEDCSGIGGASSALESRVNVQRYFRLKFRYSGDVRMSRSKDPLLDFMKHRRGICVHFSSAAALMFRSAGIPSRVVVGYVCMEWNPWIKRFVVREREGHAWVEIWDRQQNKWLLVEPTPPAGIPAFKEQSGMMRLAKDAVISSWKRFVTWVSTANILQVIAATGAAVVLFVVDLALSPWGGALLTGFVLFVWWRRRKSRLILTEEEQLRSELTAMMHKIANRAIPDEYRIQRAECWDSWLKRVKDHLPAETYAELSQTVERYQVLRYSRTLDVSAAQRWLKESAPGDNREK